MSQLSDLCCRSEGVSAGGLVGCAYRGTPDTHGPGPGTQDEYITKKEGGGAVLSLRMVRVGLGLD